MDKFRVAICISGQARHWRVASKNIKKYFESNTNHKIFNVPIEYDYFIHTWDTNTWRYPKTHHTVFYDEKHNDKDEIKKEFNPKYFELEEWIPEKFIRAWDALFYSFYRSLMLKRQYEVENNFEYDLVVKARFDVVYNPKHTFEIQNFNPGIFGLIPGICYTVLNINKFPNEFNYNSFDDVIFYGDSKTMDLVGTLYHSYQKLFDSEEFDYYDINPSFFYGPGSLLYEHMVNISIHPESLIHTEYCVVRSTALENGPLDSVIDYEKIKEYSVNWYGQF